MSIHFIDTHAHLEWRDFNSDREKVIEYSKERGVGEIITVGYDPEGNQRTIELSRQFPHIYASVGIHPHESALLNQENLESLKTLCSHSSVVAIGEIGLDYYRNLSPKDIQISSLKNQIELALELDLPIIVHDREAHGDILKILHEYKGRVRGVMHCFSGSLELAKQCIDLGFFISFAGPITYPNARRLGLIVSKIPLEHMLIETDCPWLAPQPVRGKRNEPAYVVYIAEKISEIKDTPIEEIAKVTTRNARKIFNLP